MREILDYCLEELRRDVGILALDELLVEQDCTGEELEDWALKNGCEKQMKKIKSLLHINNLRYMKGVGDKAMVGVVMKRLGAEFGYVDRKDVTSNGKEIQNIVLPLELIPREVLENVRKIDGKAD